MRLGLFPCRQVERGADNQGRGRSIMAVSEHVWEGEVQGHGLSLLGRHGRFQPGPARAAV